MHSAQRAPVGEVMRDDRQVTGEQDNTKTVSDRSSVAGSDPGQEFVAEIVFLTQRANSRTWDTAGSVIERSAGRFANNWPERVKNVAAFKDCVAKLRLQLSRLAGIETGTADEIIIKQAALDLLLAIRHEIAPGNSIEEPKPDVADADPQLDEGSRLSA